MAASLPTTIEGVLTRLRAIDGSLPSGDGAAVFNRMYLTVTERVAEAIERAEFTDAGFMAELDVRFANLWLAAYDAVAAGDQPTSAWRPLFETRAAAGVLPVQFALAGMNAHIEHDLPLAVVATCRARSLDPGPAVREDYERVNAVLAGVESEIRRSFLTWVGRGVDQEVGSVVHLVSAWNIDKARDVAWVTVEMLWALRALRRLYERCVATLSDTVGMASRALLTPVPGVRGPIG
ncbi:DUF5995 family protein [Ornithinicoccus halotolerans]|uniref:DUF5995 family protein n=1 Tax=Ornithinicoccus halotolerans TaxID=1748220 RepID=UPI001295F4FF|nr:DUF5995 family protein [Ornithinicoccus halotolerans]